VQGVPLYKRARKGQVVEREPRLIHVYRFSMDSWDPPRAGFTLECTKGTYVRTLCADIGEALGCGAHLESLCRTRSGEFGIERAHPLADLMKLSEEEFLQRIVPIRDVIRGVTAPPPG
jgi:tRNA pseudouridine55 synthase